MKIKKKKISLFNFIWLFLIYFNSNLIVNNEILKNEKILLFYI